MNWIKIDHEKLLEIIRSAYMSGGHDSEEGCYQWCKQGSEERAEEIYEELVDNETIEKPKEKKYNSIDEFHDKSGLFPDISYSRYEGATKICIDWFCKNQPPDTYIPRWKSFTGNSFSECEQKLIEWANDEYRQ